MAHLFHGWNEGIVEFLSQVAIGQVFQCFGEHPDCAHALGHIRRKLHDLIDLALAVNDRVVGCLDPDFLAALAETPEFIGSKFAAPKPLPELPVFLRLHIGGITEHPMMPALNFLQLISQRTAEVFIGGNDFAGRGKLDHRLRAGNGIQLAGILHRFLADGGDVGCELYYLVGLAAAEDRVIGSLDPDLAAALGDTFVLLPVKFATAEPGPEFAVFHTACFRRIDKNPVMLASDLPKLIAQRRTEIRIGIEDITVEIEFDNRLRRMHRG